MIMLSRMILRQPQVVLLDEPTASMDEQLGRSRDPPDAELDQWTNVNPGHAPSRTC